MLRAYSLLQAQALGLGPTSLALGLFDGVHLGHAALLQTCVRLAHAQGLQSVAVTFDPHPAKCLRPASAPPSVEPLHLRLDRFAALGLHAAVVLPFDRTLAATLAEDFVDHILADALQARHVVVGQDFVYGKAQGGNVASLRAHGQRGAGATRHPFAVHALTPVAGGEATASSTRVRAAIAAGDLAGAEAVLGRPYALYGKVVPGLQRGRTLGFPTANLAPEAELMPAFGVYAAWVTLPFGRFAAAVSVGVHPTFDEAPQTKVECYLLDYQGSPFYGASMQVTLTARLRGEQRFSSAEALVAQMHADCAEVRRCLGLPAASA